MPNAFILFGKLEGDTTGFQNSMRQADTVLKNTGHTIQLVEGEAKDLGLQSAVTGRHFDRMREALAKANANLLATVQGFLKGDVSAKQMASALGQVERAADRVNSKLKDTTARLKEGQGVSGGFGDAIGGAALARFGPAAAIAAVIAAATTGGKAVLDYSSKLEQLRIGFEGLTGSVEKANQHLKDLQQFAAKTPFDFAEIADASRKFQALGFRAEEVIPVLTDLGNILAGSGRIDALPEAAKALSDIKAKGKLAGQEIIQLANAGIGIREVLAKELGISVEKVVEIGEKGQISADMVFKAVHRLAQERFGDALAKQSNTFAGAMENIQDKVRLLSSTAFKPLFDEISGLAVNLNKEIDKQGGDFIKIGELIGEYIAKGIEAGVVAGAQALPGIIANQAKDKLTGGLGKTMEAAISGATSFTAILPTGPLKKLGSSVGQQIALAIGLATQEELDRFNKGSLQDFITSTFENLNIPTVKTDGGVLTFLDPVTNTLKQIQLEAPKTAEALKNVVSEEAKKKAQNLADSLANLVKGLSNQVSYFGDESQEAKIKQQLLTLGVTDFKNAVAHSAISLAKQLDALVASEKAAKEYKEALEKTNEKLDEMQKKALSAFDDLATDNPFTKLFTDAEKAINSVREATQGFSKQIVDGLTGAVQKANELALVSLRISSAIGQLDARIAAQNLRAPTSEELQADFARMTKGRFLTDEEGNVSEVPGLHVSPYALELVRKQLANAKDAEKIQKQLELEQRVASVKDLQTRFGATPELDRQIQGLASQFSKEELGADVREFIAQAFDREAERQAKMELSAMEFYDGKKRWQQEISDFIVARKEEAKNSKDGKLEITVKDEAGKVARVTSPTPATVEAGFYTGTLN